jgi:hypothetical protein
MPSSTALSARAASKTSDCALVEVRSRPQGDQVRFGTPLQRALVDPIGLRAFQRGIESSLLEAFARPLDYGSEALQHPGDLSVAERLCLGVFAYTSTRSRMRARFNLRAGAVPEEMSLCNYSRCCSLSSTRYFFFKAALLQRRISHRISRSIQTSNHR